MTCRARAHYISCFALVWSIFPANNLVQQGHLAVFDALLRQLGRLPYQALLRYT